MFVLLTTFLVVCVWRFDCGLFCLWFVVARIDLGFCGFCFTVVVVWVWLLCVVCLCVDLYLLPFDLGILWRCVWLI